MESRLVDQMHAVSFRENGFTIVELVIVIILIGILSSLGIGLIVSPSAYSAGAARDQFVSSALLAQKRALANTDGTTTLTLEQTDSEWRFLVPDNGTSYPERSAAREGAELEIGGSNLSNGSSRDFEFDARGHLTSDVNIEFVFDGTSEHKACLSSLGFAYPQGCQP